MNFTLAMIIEYLIIFLINYNYEIVNQSYVFFIADAGASNVNI